jgi:hypothetical protein
MTQEVCAGLVGRSLSWWKKVEQGVRHIEKLSDLILVCQVLRVPELSDLTGVLEYSLSVDRQRPQPVLPEVRRAMLTTTASASEPPDLDVLRARLDQARRTFHTHLLFITQCGALLPGLITDLTAAYRRVTDAPVRRSLAGMLSELYVLACQVLRDAGDFPLAWTAADRATSYAYEADDPLAIGWAAWEASGVLKDLGNPDEGLVHCQNALEELGRLLELAATDERLSVYGELSGQAGLMAAPCSDEGTALRYWDIGMTAYGRVSDSYRSPVTRYSQEGGELILVWINAALGRHRATIAAADRVDVSATPSRPLQSLWLVNVAKGYAGRADDVATLHLLTRAEQTSPEIVARNVHVREIIRQMLRRDRATIRAELHQLAHRVGLLN